MAAEIVVAIGLTAAVARSSISAWWVLPAIVVFVLYTSLRRATKAARRGRAPTS